MSKIVFKCQLKNSIQNSDCICLVDEKIWRDLSKSSRTKTLCVVRMIANGASFFSFGGKIIKCNSSLVRFRIGRSLRLVLLRKKESLVFNLFYRQGYEKYFKSIN
ncbi:hypothetical protein [Photobacterium phosphoreum]|uniref:ParE family toxin-like protein n=1 Tax=Photobacterium phosphoreum TaxID=659 RepID=UPI000D157028|nr:hypothetical protein DAT36_11855 [Photobacterium phosphoreum]